jgi:hypothetical protein
MKNAVGRATAALTQTGQKVGAIRYASVDVRQLEGLATLASGVNERAFVARTPAALPSVAPEKITVSATVQCAFQIQ